MLIPLAVFGITAVVNMCAPGTKVRGGSDFGFPNIFYAIGKAVYKGLKDVRSEYLGNPVIVIGMIVIALFLASQMIGKQYELSFRYPGLFVMMTFGSYLAMHAPNYYSSVGAPFGRMSNLISFYFELSIIADMIYVGYLTKKGSRKWQDGGKKFMEKWEVYKIYVLLGAFILILAHPGWYATTAVVRMIGQIQR